MTSYYPPIASESEVETILQSCYQIESRNLIKLKGFDNINYLVEVLKSPENISAQNVLLKIGPCSEPPEKVDFLHEQVNLMQNLNEDLPQLIQKIYTSKDGNLVTKYEVFCQKDSKNKHYHNVVLLEFIAAVPMIEALPFSFSLIEDVGRSFAKLSESLQKHSTKTLLNRKNHKWDPKNVLQCEEFLYLENNPDRKEVFEEFFAKFKNEILPHIERTCTRGLIHSDGSCNNILVQSDNFNKVRGIIDFEDVCNSYLIFESASLLMYTFTYMPNCNFAQFGHALMKGFTEIIPLSPDEWEALIDATLARHVQSLIWGLEASALNPGNSEYVLETQERGWLSFKKLNECDREKMLEEWQKV
ncbi:hydroxylysine kinase-like [Convolutriloba macropyga]|uniref:hydroxylysine kinase-like n=1 Tax=Convolutriloba macropyga TaxID=536237 RepID=UPI003F523326